MDVYNRDDFSSGSNSITEIEEKLYLGGLAAAKRVKNLNKFNITHILTINEFPLPQQITEPDHMTSKFIQLADMFKVDLLIHFDDTEAFILDGMRKGAVLVHCQIGMSRSATVVIAFIMKKYQLSYFEALEKVKQKRSIVRPNRAFVSQLQLYKEMNYKIDKSNMNYKMFQLNIAAYSVMKVKSLPENFFDLIKPDPGKMQSQPEPNVYRCKECRRILACESNFLTHLNDCETCTQTFFIELLAWMNVTKITQGQLHCPKCSGEVGSFDWIKGCQCPCGVYVHPAFYLTPSKVDKDNMPSEGFARSKNEITLNYSN